MSLLIRAATTDDWPGIWAFMEGIFRAGDSYPNAVDTTQEQAREYWLGSGKTIHVAVDEGGQILGTSYVRPNQIGRAAHVCNGGYMVSPAARGKGVATELCIHSQEIARAQGYLAMQYNLVVSTNLAAVALWQKLGFEIVGTLPGGFRHKNMGFVDAHVMFKWLVERPTPPNSQAKSQPNSQAKSQPNSQAKSRPASQPQSRRDK